jgi:sulfoxide reductase heme-binding subunit YedZ
MRGWICAETIEPVTLHGIIGRVVRPLIVVGGILPAVVLVIRLLTGTLGADPAEDLEHSTGLTALILLLSSLAMTPLKRLTGLTALVRLRKPLGLWAFAYAVMHLSCYLVFDQSLLWGEIGRDIVKRPYITVGFAAFLILLTLAVTSPAAMIRKLGGQRWQRLHRLAYVAAVLAVLHFLWLVKLDITEPTIAGMVLIGLLALRIERRPAGQTKNGNIGQAR